MKLRGWRKIAGAMWGPPDHPQIYGAMEFDATPLKALIARARELGHRVTPKHFVGRAVALSGVKIERADEKSVFHIAGELAERAGGMKAGDDPDLARTKKTMEAVPRRVLKASMRFSAWMAGDRNRDIKALGVKASPFGAAMITSVGMFGLPQGFAPLARFYKMQSYMADPAEFEPEVAGSPAPEPTPTLAP